MYFLDFDASGQFVKIEKIHCISHLNAAKYALFFYYFGVIERSSHNPVDELCLAFKAFMN